MKLNCVSCGHAIDLRTAYDDYDGQVKCFACGGLLAVRTEEGQVKWVERVVPHHHDEESTLQRTR